MAALARIGLSRRPNDRIQHPGRHRNADHVVDERPEQILPASCASCARDSAIACASAAQVAAHQHNVRRLDRDVGAVPIAMPTSACASAGASLMPSPTIATTLPCRCSAVTPRPSPSGSASATTALMPAASRHGIGGARGVAGEHDDVETESAQRRATASREVGGSDRRPRHAATQPSIATNTMVFPSRARRSASSRSGARRPLPARASRPRCRIGRGGRRPSPDSASAWLDWRSRRASAASHASIAARAAHDRVGERMLRKSFDRRDSARASRPRWSPGAGTNVGHGGPALRSPCRSCRARPCRRRRRAAALLRP